MRHKRGKNEGSIFRPKDRKGWAGTIPARYHHSGKPHRIYGRTREDVSRKLAEAISGKAVQPSKSRDTVEEYLDQWLKAIDVSPSTWDSYFYACKHINRELGLKKLRSLTPSDVTACLAGIREKGLTARTVAYALTVLRRALSVAFREGLVSRNVASREFIDPVKRPDQVIRPLNMAETGRLVAAVQVGEYHVLVAVSMGLRLGEVLGLRWQDVDFDAKTIRVVQAIQRTKGELRVVSVKTESSRRLLRAPEVILSALSKYRAMQMERRLKLGEKWQDRDLVFPSRNGSPMEPRNALRLYHKVLKRAGLSGFTFHALRHTAATNMLTMGIPLEIVSKILGHSSIAITHKVYAHYSLSQQDSAMSEMDALVRGHAKSIL